MQKKPHPSLAELSLKAKGAYAILEALQEDLEALNNGLTSTATLRHYTTNGDVAVSSAVEELMLAGYVEYKQLIADNGRFLGGGLRIVPMDDEQ